MQIRVNWNKSKLLQKQNKEAAQNKHGHPPTKNQEFG
jgi:hypothetical protein